MEQTTPIFTKTFDFVSWLLGAANQFPRTQRFVVTKRLLDAALNLQELLVDANACRGRARLGKLDLARKWFDLAWRAASRRGAEGQIARHRRNLDDVRWPLDPVQ